MQKRIGQARSLCIRRRIVEAAIRLHRQIGFVAGSNLRTRRYVVTGRGRALAVVRGADEQAAGASGPDMPKPTPVEKFLSTHPAALAFVTTPRPVAVSYGTQPFFGVKAFKFTNAQGTSKFGRSLFTGQTNNRERNRRCRESNRANRWPTDESQ